jgi:hypothetical protein
MSYKPLVAILFITAISCEIPVQTFVRNVSETPALLDVYYLDPTQIKTNVDSVKVANEIVNFKKTDFRKKFNSRQDLKWLDSSHYQLALQPKTTVDLGDLFRGIANDRQHYSLRVVITKGESIDTVMNGSLRKRLEIESIGTIKQGVFYDIQ